MTAGSSACRPGRNWNATFLERDRLLAILPKRQPLIRRARFPVAALGDYPFILLEKGGRDDVTELFRRSRIIPRIRFTTWDDYVMSMV